MKCPSGDDSDYPGELLCMSGVAECKNKMGFDYCGADWNSVDCAPATPCPRGDGCADGEKCIVFTNCGSSFTVANNPTVEGGGPDAKAVKSTSMQFLENNSNVPLLVQMAPSMIMLQIRRGICFPTKEGSQPITEATQTFYSQER